MLVKISKYVESSTGRQALRIEFYDVAIQAMTRLFGERWQFTPMLTHCEDGKIAIMLSGPAGEAATYQAKFSADPAAPKKVVILHDFHLKGQSLANIPNFKPTEVVLAGPQISNHGLVIKLPDAGQVGEANPQTDMFNLPRPKKTAVPALKSVCDLTLRFADGTKMTRAISMADAVEIASKYINRK